jgi:hypothetical protein
VWVAARIRTSIIGIAFEHGSSPVMLLFLFRLFFGMVLDKLHERFVTIPQDIADPKHGNLPGLAPTPNG